MPTTAQSKPQETPLNETCSICDRVRWGSYVYLGNSRWRHGECHPGSASWLEWYAKLPKERRTSAGDLLYSHYRKEKPTLEE